MLLPLHEYQKKRLMKFAFCKWLILKGAILVVLDLQVLKWLPKKEKREPFGSAPGKQAPAIQTQ